MTDSFQDAFIYRRIAFTVFIYYNNYTELLEGDGGDIMIRKVQTTDADRVADIWLDTNIRAHNFIPAQYWQKNFEMVKAMLAQAEVYVYEDDKEIQGFIGLNGDYIAGLFVCVAVQSGGIGTQLLDFVKELKKELCLNVYQKNTRAVQFYQREKFWIQSEGMDEDTGEKEYFMKWEQ